jgi:hypothetical protein
MLPMSVRSRLPHPLDALTQSGTIGQDNEVDRQAVRGRPADRSWMSPPPTSSTASFSRSTNSIAPKSSASDVRSASGGDDVGAALTCELVTIDPTEPAAPCTRTLCPA